MASHLEKADEYYEYLAGNFPVMCASDEFVSFPRAEKASLLYGEMESLEKDLVVTKYIRFI